MIEYHVIGKVMEEKPAIIIFNNSYYEGIHRSPSIIYLPCKLEEIIKYFYYNNPITYSDSMKLFKEYKECFIIESEKEFNTGCIINHDDKDYFVTYKYNSELQQHQLYIDYEMELIKLDETTINNCKLIFDTCLEYRNKARSEENKEITKENIFNRLKRLFTRK